MSAGQTQAAELIHHGVKSIRLHDRREQESARDDKLVTRCVEVLMMFSFFFFSNLHNARNNPLIMNHLASTTPRKTYYKKKKKIDFYPTPHFAKAVRHSRNVRRLQRKPGIVTAGFSSGGIIRGPRYRGNLEKGNRRAELLGKARRRRLFRVTSDSPPGHLSEQRAITAVSILQFVFLFPPLSRLNGTNQSS